jgi:hypothetical protein
VGKLHSGSMGPGLLGDDFAHYIVPHVLIRCMPPQVTKPQSASEMLIYHAKRSRTQSWKYVANYSPSSNIACMYNDNLFYVCSA